MAGQFDFTSPGAAFSDSLSNTLLERKALERQNLLDTLSMKAEQRAENEAQEMAKYRDFEIKSGQQRNEIEQLGAMTSHLQPGDDPEALGFSPEQIKLGQKYGVWQSKQVPDSSAQVQTGPDGQPMPVPNKTVYSYIGTPQQRELTQMRQQTAAAIAAMPDGPDKINAQKIAAVNNGIMPEQMQGQFFGGGKKLFRYNYEKDRLEDWSGHPVDLSANGGELPTNAEVLTRGWRPQVPHYRMPIQVGVDKDNHPVMYDPDTRETTVVGNAFSTYRDNQPGAGGGGRSAVQSYGVGLPTWDRFSVASNQLDSSPDDAGALNEWRRSAREVIGSAKISPYVRDRLHQFINNPAAIQDPGIPKGYTQRDIDRDRADYEFFKEQLMPGDVTTLIKHPLKGSAPVPSAAPPVNTPIPQPNSAPAFFPSAPGYDPASTQKLVNLALSNYWNSLNQTQGVTPQQVTDIQAQRIK